MQVICILMVVIFHSLYFYDDLHGEYTYLGRIIYSVALPTFLFISGFLLIYSILLSQNKSLQPRRFIINKIKRLILPFATLTLVTFVPRAALSAFAEDNIPVDFRHFFLAFIDQDFLIIPYFWFIHVLFLLLIITYFTIYFTLKLKLPIIYTLSFLFIIMLIYHFLPIPEYSILSLCKFQEFGFYFLLGGICACFYKKFIYTVKLSNGPIVILLMIIWLISVKILNSFVGICITGLLGILALISFTSWLEKHNFNFFRHLRSANFLIFLLSWYLNVFTQQFLSHFILFPWWIHSLMSLTSGIYVPWLGYRYLQSHPDSRWVRVTAFLLGQKIPSQQSNN